MKVGLKSGIDNESKPGCLRQANQAKLKRFQKCNAAKAVTKAVTQEQQEQLQESSGFGSCSQNLASLKPLNMPIPSRLGVST